MRKINKSFPDGGTADASEPFQRITNAPEPLAVDQGHRMRVYGLQMAIRVVCLFLAVLIPHPIRWVFVAGAVFIPYIAVLLANAGRDRVTTDTFVLDPRQLTSGPGPDPRPSATPPPKDTEFPRDNPSQTDSPPTATPETER